MKENLYHKINGPFKRDMNVKPSPLIFGDWATPEFELLKDVQWVGYEKIDGTNIRIKFHDGKLHFGGRTENSDIPEHLMDYLNETFSPALLSEYFRELGTDQLTLYGEGTGHKIQGGDKYFSPKIGVVQFILFDVTIGDWVLTGDSVSQIASNLGILRTPKIIEGTLHDIFKRVQEGFMSMYGNFYAEGIVATPKHQLFDRAGRRIITKIKHKDFFKKDLTII